MNVWKDVSQLGWMHELKLMKLFVVLISKEPSLFKCVWSDGHERFVERWQENANNRIKPMKWQTKSRKIYRYILLEQYQKLNFYSSLKWGTPPEMKYCLFIHIYIYIYIYIYISISLCSRISGKKSRCDRNHFVGFIWLLEPCNKCCL